MPYPARALLNPEDEAAAGEREAQLVDWSRLDRTRERLEWQRLEQWLDQWLVPTYEIVLDELPPCWMHDPAMREELSWLRSAWAGAYRTGGSGAAAGEWHAQLIAHCV